MNRKDFIKSIIGLSGFIFSQLIFGKNENITASSNVFKNDAPKSLWKYSKEVYHYIKMGNTIQCTTCPNRCILEKGDRGICRDKVFIKNTDKLYNIAYGNPSSIHLDPVEKKPLYHFYPGSKAFSIAPGGCPLRCLNCHNWELSQSSPESLHYYELFPKQVIEKTIEYKSKSIAFDFSESVAWYEYMYDTAKIAKEKGIKNIWVTSGYIEEEPLKKLSEVIDAANVDLKSFSDEIYNNLNAGKLKPILNTLKILHKKNVWFEITCLIVPTYSNSLSMIRNMCKWIMDNLGDSYPVHFTRFNAAYKLTHLPPTPITTLEDAYQIALNTGLKFVYIGNVPGTKASNTLCPSCKKIIIERVGYETIKNFIKNAKCTYCNTKIEGRWQ